MCLTTLKVKILTKILTKILIKILNRFANETAETYEQFETCSLRRAVCIDWTRLH
jgi:hypothetical protein